MGATSSIDLAPRSGAAVAQARGRVGNLDVLRAVAALAVLTIHAYALGGRIAPIKAQYWYDVPLITLATGVWLFFGISGYVISRPFIDRLLTGRPLPKTRGYALRRALRIFPLYWVALTILIAIDGSGGTSGWQLPFHYLLLNNLIPGQEQALFPAAWTLTLEAIFYVAVPILAVAVGGRMRRVSAERLALLVVGSWLASVIFAAWADLLGDGEIGLWLRGAFPAMWQMFCPGILIAIAPHLKAPAWRRWLVELPGSGLATVAAVLTLVAAAVLGAAAPLRFGVVPYQLLVDASRPLFAIGYGVLIAAAIRSRPWKQRSRWVVELGLVSYGIYLLHPLFVELFLRDGVLPAHRDTVFAFATNTALIAAVTIPVALASWRWFERPLVELSRRLG
jgi:peptidoglycan/LPS O-acetylase OafA/YrhL